MFNSAESTTESCLHWCNLENDSSVNAISRHSHNRAITLKKQHKRIKKIINIIGFGPFRIHFSSIS